MKISIIIPVFNSSKILEVLVKEIKANLKEFNDFEIILINDFSSDSSWEIIKKLKVNNNFIKGINLKKNYGQHSAIFCGLKYCTGDFIVCMDDDMQHDPKHIDDMLKELNFFDVCYVKYKKREHNFIKIFVSRLNNIVSSFLMNKSYKIYTSSFKCFKKSVRDKIISNKEDFIFLDYWIFQYTKKITFIYVSHNKGHQGNTNYGFRELLTLWSRMIFLIKFKKSNYKFYLIFILKSFFLTFLKKYIRYENNSKIDVAEIV